MKENFKELVKRGLVHGLELLFGFAGIAIFTQAVKKDFRIELLIVLAVYLFLGLGKLADIFEGYDLASKYKK